MPTVEERIRQVTSKVERAKKHIADLTREIQVFLEGKPHKDGVRRDPETRRLHYYMESVAPIPEILALIAGDAIQNLMSALDHMAYQLVSSDTTDAPPEPSKIHFPIRDSAAQYEGDKRRKMKGASEETFKGLDEARPYKGGNDQLWILYKLNNIDKHRQLLTVGSAFRSVNLAAVGLRHLQQAIDSNPDSPLRGRLGKYVEPVNKYAPFYKVADPLFPLKPGVELFIDAPDATVHENLFRYDVGLIEFCVESASLLETLQKLTIAVEQAIATLIPHLKEPEQPRL